MKIIDFKTREILESSSFVIVKKIYVEINDINFIATSLTKISDKIIFSHNPNKVFQDLHEIIIYLEGLSKLEVKKTLIFLKRRNN